MIQDRNDQYGHEDGEYHFTDDQANYDFESEAQPAAPQPKAGPNPARIKKIATGVVGVLVLIFLVFRLFAPSAPGGTAIPTSKSFAKMKPAQNPTLPAMPEAQPMAQPNAAPAPVNMNQTPSLAAAMPQAAQPVQEQPAQPQAQPLPAAPQAMNNPAPAMPPQPMRESSPALVMSEGSAPVPLPGNDAKLAEMAAENAKAQADLTQKLATVTAQNQALETEVQQLTTQITALESSMARLNQNLQEVRLAKPNQQALAAAGAMGAANATPPQSQSAGAMQQMPAEVKRTVTSHMNYTVQAIIPGRAWLKSDSGETVTVAEGDVIREFGRVVKIDPYDGVVDIDMNGKLISLSYGAGAE